MAKLTFCGAEVNESNAATLTRARAVCNELWHRLCALDCTHCSTPMQLGNRGGAPRIRAAWYSVGIKATCKGHAKPRADCERRTARPPGVDGTTMRHAEAVPRVGTSVVTRGVCILDYFVFRPVSGMLHRGPAVCLIQMVQSRRSLSRETVAGADAAPGIARRRHLDGNTQRIVLSVTV